MMAIARRTPGSLVAVPRGSRQLMLTSIFVDPDPDCVKTHIALLFANDPLDAGRWFYDTLAHEMGERIFLTLAIGFGIVIPMAFVCSGSGTWCVEARAASVLIRHDRRRVADVLDEIGLDTSSAQRGQDVPGNAHVFIILVVGLRAVGAHPIVECPTLVPAHASAGGTHLRAFGDRRDASPPPFITRPTRYRTPPRLVCSRACLATTAARGIGFASSNRARAPEITDTASSVIQVVAILVQGVHGSMLARTAIGTDDASLRSIMRPPVSH